MLSKLKFWKKTQPKHTKARYRNSVPNKGDYQTSLCIANNYDEYVVPQIAFSDMFGMQELKQQVITAAKSIRASWPSEKPKNGILLYGPPGNGKTMVAEMIAGSYQIPLFEIKASSITSQYVGETTRALKESFDFVKRNTPCVLLLDEVDSLMATLSKNSQDERRDIRSTILTELVELRNFPVFVVAATNYYDKLDPASIREGRFDYKIEVGSPDYAARLGLLSKTLRRSEVSSDLLNVVAKRYAGFSVKRVLSISESVADSTVGRKVTIEDFSKALRKIQGTKGDALKDVLGLNDLVYNHSLSIKIEQLVAQLKKVDELIVFGAKMPKGALFVGPAGTGKTALAKAMAKESGWAFLSAAGPDLLQDIGKLDEIYNKAKDIRPCVIFIDEATQLVAERTTSRFSEHTNKLLTIIDGFGEDIQDVVFFAATNHGDNVDEAIARRLHQRIEFELPDKSTVRKLVQKWADKHPYVRNQVLNDIDRICLKLEGLSHSRISTSLDQAYSRAVLDKLQKKSKLTFELTTA